MATLTSSNVVLRGISSAIPDQCLGPEVWDERFGIEEASRISESIGVSSRPVVPEGICASDLCYEAAEDLLESLNWERDTIEAVLFVSQTPDHPLPATACILQNRLGLPTSSIAFDVNLGCSGYVYGLSIATQFISSNSVNRALLLVGDTLSHLVSEQDKSTGLLFGDAGTATAIERQDGAPDMKFQLGTDGGGMQHLIVPAGMSRLRRCRETSLRQEDEGGSLRSPEELFMDGAEVFSFTLTRVPRLVRSVLDNAGWTMDEVDAVVMHQANEFMLNHLAKRVKVPPEKLILAMESFGNTSCASIPLAINAKMREQISQRPMKLLLVGFGVGWSWGAVTITCGPIAVPEVVSVSSPSAA